MTGNHTDRRGPGADDVPAAAPPSAGTDANTTEGTGGARATSRVERLERRLAVPVVTAAAVSVPAVFLTTMESGYYALVGTVLNWVSLAVLGSESVLLLVFARARLGWVWRHKWTLAVTLLAVPAAIFTLAPVQALRLLRIVTTLRILRANRIIKAGRVLARRTGLAGPWRYLPIVAGSALATGFSALVLADPTSTTRLLIARIAGAVCAVPVPLALGAGAGAGAALATVLLWRRRRD